MPEYLVTVEISRVEQWRVEAPCHEDAEMFYDEGEKVSEDVKVTVVSADPLD